MKQKGADVLLCDLNDHEALKKAAAASEAVIHTGFNHDFSRYKESCEEDRRLILAFGQALSGTDKPLVITSGTGIVNSEGLTVEADFPPSSDVAARAASEEAARIIQADGVACYIVRLPPTVHGKSDKGFKPMLVDLAREKGEAAFISGLGNQWAAVHRFDAAKIYRLAIEKKPAQNVFHAVAEEGIPFQEIAESIGNGLGLETVGKNGEEAEAYFGWFRYFAGMDGSASAEKTKAILGWKPIHPTLSDDFKQGFYF